MTLRPIIGVLFGILLIIYRRQVSRFLQKSYENFPVNKMSGKVYDLSYRVRPVFVTLIGATLIAFSIMSFIMENIVK